MKRRRGPRSGGAARHAQAATSLGQPLAADKLAPQALDEAGPDEENEDRRDADYRRCRRWEEEEEGMMVLSNTGQERGERREDQPPPRLGTEKTHHTAQST